MLNLIFIIIIIVILVIYFIYEIINYRKVINQDRWPPWGRPLPCPDYWIHKGNNVCVNPFKLGSGYPKGSQPIMEYDMKKLSGCLNNHQGSRECLVSKCEFAHKSNNPWFGVQPNCVQSGKCYCPF